MSSGLPGKPLVVHVAAELHLLCTKWISYLLQDGIGALSPGLRPDEHFISIDKTGTLWTVKLKKSLCVYQVVLQNPARQNKYLNRSLLFFSFCSN